MAAAPEPFRTSGEHLFAELRRLDLLLRRAVLLARAVRGGEDLGEFRGLVISEENVDRMLESIDFLGENWKIDASTANLVGTVDSAIEKRRVENNARAQAAKRLGTTLSLARLASAAALSAAEVDLVLVALAPELEPRYETIYAYLQNDVTRKRPSVDLALNLICQTKEEKLQARALFSAGAPLLHFRILQLLEEPYDREATQARRFIKLDDRVLMFLLEQAPTAIPSANLSVEAATIVGLGISAASKTQLQNLAIALERGGSEHTIINLIGDAGAPLMETAAALATTMGRMLSTFDLRSSDVTPDTFFSQVRDAVLWDAVIAVIMVPNGVTETEQQRKVSLEQALWRRLRDTSSPVIVIGAGLDYGLLPQGARLWRITVEPPDYEIRKTLWEETLAGSVAGADVSRLADMFPFPEARIQQISALAASQAALRNPSEPATTMDDLLAAGRTLATPNIRRFAIPITPVHDWNDLVLPPDRVRQLKAIEARVTHRHVVLREWQFGRKLSRGRGTSVLFAGLSGTGKTMAAEVLANALGLDLFQIDLSTVVSKFIGETEKHLSAIFSEAEQSLSVLFFDECDSLFGKRTEVKDAHDRYANIEVNYLLQRMEQYEGMCILATNFQKNLDEAFMRRLQDVVEFPFPDETAREEIWRRQFSNPKMLAEDVNLAYLGSQFKMSGGSIRNAAINAAFLAAAENSEQPAIAMRHMLSAVRREFQKQGRLIMKSDLGQYAREFQEAPQ